MTYIICEIGVNHNGCADTLRRLVDAACDLDVDAVKFQLFDAATINRPAHVKAMLAGLQLNPMDIWRQALRVARTDKHPMVTPFGEDQLRLAESMACWRAYKIGHAESENAEWRNMVWSFGHVVYASTTGDKPLDTRCRWMHVSPHYPTPESGIRWLSVLNIGGYSDHTGDVHAAFTARMYRAERVEFHLTLDKGAAGPDHRSSLTPKEAKQYVRELRK